MIFGIGTDIAEVSRFQKWVLRPEMTERFFNEKEICEKSVSSVPALCRHYAARFAAKEAFSKALGTGLFPLKLKEICVLKDDSGKPYFEFGDSVKKIIREKISGRYSVHLTLSHEKEYAVAFVIIEKIG